MSDPFPLSPAEGFIESGVRAEFPALRLHWLTVEARRRPTPPGLVRRLHYMSSRYRGASVVAMRTQPIPQAYRTFFRQIGLDPDVRRIPSEAAAVSRLTHGGFRSVDLITDACLVALVETGVPVWALDADQVDAGGLGIRIVTDEDRARFEAEGVYLDPGTLLVTDHTTVHGQLFADPDQRYTVSASTQRVALFTIAVPGVPAIHVEEALWMCVELLN